MTAWLAMTVAAVASRISGSEPPPGRQQIERIFDRLGIDEDQRALAEIVRDQSRQDQKQPGVLDRPPPEMPHVGVQRLGAGNGEEDAAEHDEADRSMDAQEGQSRKRAQRAQDAPCRGNVDDAENRR